MTGAHSSKMKNEINDNNEDKKKDPLLRYSDKDLETDAFTKLLGLPKISLGQLFSMSKETDELVLEVMAENAHFVHLLEGYPDLMSFKHSVTSKNSTAKVS
jgi:hypothetical protein